MQSRTPSILDDIHSHKTYPLFIVTWIYKHSLEEQEYTHCIQYTFASVNYKCGTINNSFGYFAYGFLHFLIQSLRVNENIGSV